MKPIRILCVFSTLDRGGAESMCMNLYRHIDRTQVQFDFVKHTHEKGGFEDEILSLGGKIFEAPRYYLYNHLSYTKWWDDFLTQHTEYRVIHGHFFTISSVFLKAAKKHGLYTISHSHCAPSTDRSLKNFLSDRLVMRMERVSDFCFACSREAGAWVYPHKPFTVLNNAVDAELFRYDAGVRREMRAALGMTDELVLGTVGRIMHQKNPLGTVDIFKAVHDRQPNAKLLWIGNGDMRADAGARAAQYGLADAVIFTGVRSDVEKLLQAMDVFVFPSFYEGLSVVSVEAQAAGLPCFISDQVTRECKVTENCRFLPLHQPALWAERILSADLSRGDTRQQIIDAGYDIHTTAKWLQEFYIKAYEENTSCRH